MCLQANWSFSVDSESGFRFEQSSFLLDEIEAMHIQLSDNIIVSNLRNCFQGQTISYHDLGEDG